MDPIAFIDLEASGLNAESWPIEVGWCHIGKKPQSFLIKPQKEWSMSAWDEAAEKLHGVKRSELDKKGIDPEKICAELNRGLEGSTVYSDAPDWDGFWLYRLFRAAGVKQAFKLTDFHQVVGSIAPETLTKMVAEATKTAPHSHRAEDDVLHMMALYQMAAKGD